MSDKFVIIECKGKQYIVSEGDVLSVDLLNNEPKDKIVLDQVLLYSDKKKVNVGQPHLDMTVSAEVIAHERDKKVHVFKFKKKTGFKKKQGHKQKYTTIKINSIDAKKSKAKESKVADSEVADSEKKAEKPKSTTKKTTDSKATKK